VATELETAGAKVALTQADVGAEAACLAFVNGAAQQFGRLDILVNNAGIRKYEKVNLMSYVFCAKGGHSMPNRRSPDAPLSPAELTTLTWVAFGEARVETH
jgi:2-hydroxycyclohexanecarboxyl-CoA dehydrogenase